MTAEGRDDLVVEWASEGAPLQGEVVSGDVHVVAGFPGGALVALVDGLGHGPEAAEASRLAAETLRSGAGAPLADLFERCHEALRGSRGVAMSAASFDARRSSLSWVGVGNVEALLLRGGAGTARESLLLRGGVVGYQLPPLREGVLPLARGDTLVMVTDGIRAGFMADLPPLAGPKGMATAIFTRHTRRSDDALVVVARYRGPPA